MGTELNLCFEFYSTINIIKVILKNMKVLYEIYIKNTILIESL